MTIPTWLYDYSLGFILGFGSCLFSHWLTKRKILKRFEEYLDD